MYLGLAFTYYPSQEMTQCLLGFTTHLLPISRYEVIILLKLTMCDTIRYELDNCSYDAGFDAQTKST